MAETLNEEMDQEVGVVNEQVEIFVERTRRPRRHVRYMQMIPSMKKKLG